ncbi:short-chain dehydrogenase [Hypoxylon sp. FL1284]|nr:short-chain dehydrogenase [Hypoxylon sp. FL1284]
MAKYNKLAGKHFLVIGGTKGIGRGVVEGAIESGARVTLAGSSDASVGAAVAEVRAAYPGATVAGIACDLSGDAAEQNLEALFAAAGAAAAVDHVALTAADPLVFMGIQDVTADKARAVAHMRMNVPLLVAKVAARHLRPSNECSLTLSTGGIADRPNAGWSLIAFVAAGLQGLARNLALDLKPVRVNAVEPGPVDTPLWDSTGFNAEQKAAAFDNWAKTLPTGQVGQVEDVAEAYLYLAKDKNATGEIVKTRGGANLI